MSENTSRKLITKFYDGRLSLESYADTREQAWTTLTDIGAEVHGCNIYHGEYFVRGSLKGNLIQIEQLERDGWTWE